MISQHLIRQIRQVVIATTVLVLDKNEPVSSFTHVDDLNLLLAGEQLATDGGRFTDCGAMVEDGAVTWHAD